MTPLRITLTSDGTPMGTKVLDDRGNLLLCRRIKWELDRADKFPSLTLEIIGARLDLSMPAGQVDIHLSKKTWLGRLNSVLQRFHLLRVRIVNTQTGETVKRMWMSTGEFIKRGGKLS